MSYTFCISSSSIAQVSTLHQQRLTAQQAADTCEEENDAEEPTPLPSEDEVATAIEVSLVSFSCFVCRMAADLENSVSLEWTRDFLFFASLASPCSFLLQRTERMGSLVAGVGIGIECGRSIGVRNWSSSCKVCPSLEHSRSEDVADYVCDIDQNVPSNHTSPSLWSITTLQHIIFVLFDFSTTFSQTRHHSLSRQGLPHLFILIPRCSSQKLKSSSLPRNTAQRSKLGMKFSISTLLRSTPQASTRRKENELGLFTCLANRKRRRKPSRKLSRHSKNVELSGKRKGKRRRNSGARKGWRKLRASRRASERRRKTRDQGLGGD